MRRNASLRFGPTYRSRSPDVAETEGEDVVVKVLRVFECKVTGL